MSGEVESLKAMPPLHPRCAVRKAPRCVAWIRCFILLGVRNLWLQFADPRTFSLLVSPLSAPAPSYVPLACNGSRGCVCGIRGPLTAIGNSAASCHNPRALLTAGGSTADVIAVGDIWFASNGWVTFLFWAGRDWRPLFSRTPAPGKEEFPRNAK